MTEISTTSSRHIDALVAVLARGDHVALVPPLQLAQADAADPGDFAAVETLHFGRRAGGVSGL